MNRYEVLDISGDAGIRAFGEDLGELFKNAAAGMFGLITEMDGVSEKKEMTVSVSSGSLEGLLVSWLNELIFQFDTNGFIAKKVVFPRFSASDGSPGAGKDLFLEAVLSGEEFDPERHERRLLIKAATYHRLMIRKSDGLWQTEIVFDI